MCLPGCAAYVVRRVSHAWADGGIVNRRRRGLSWRNDARCLGADTSMLFPESAGRVPKAKLAAFIELCRGCVVSGECLRSALDPPYPPHGVWAGLTQAELLPLWVARHPDPKAEIAVLLGLQPRCEPRA